MGPRRIAFGENRQSSTIIAWIYRFVKYFVAVGFAASVPRSGIDITKKWWARLDSNQRPIDYEPTALTAELRALGSTMRGIDAAPCPAQIIIE